MTEEKKKFNNMFKRLLAFLLAAVALFSFSSCKIETVNIAEEINESAAQEVIECPNDNMIGLEKIVIFEDHVVVVLDKQICDDLKYDENEWVGNANNYTLERYLDEEDPKFSVHITNYRSNYSSSIEVINDKYVATVAFDKIDFKMEDPDKAIKIRGVRIGDFEIEFDEEYRKKLEEQANTQQGLKELYEKAKKIDEDAIQKISPNDKKRIIRILEIYHSTGKTKTELEVESRKNEVKYDYKVFAIDMDRSILYDRINRRVDIMLENGLIEEVKKLLEEYDKFPTAMQGLGYKEVVEYFDGILTKEEMIEKIKQETRRYAKRQLTWFRKNKDTIWLDGLDNLQNNINIILEEIN